MSTQFNITVDRINKFEGEGTARAFCDLSISGSLLIRGIRVVEGKNGLFVGMPRQQGKDGKWYSTIRPLTEEARQKISEVVLAAYQSAPDPDLS